MAWVCRGQKQYYYRSRRYGARVGREYFGTGPEAELAAALDQRRQQEQQARRQAAQAERQRWDGAAAVLGQLIAATDLLVDAALLSGGYRQHERGAWRKRRHAMNATDEVTTEEQATPEPLPELVRRAQQGDRTVLPWLRRALDADPELWRRHGDLAAQAQASWIALVAGPDLVLRECLERKMDELRAELAGPSPSPLERLLVERVTICSLQAQFSDAAYAQARGPDATPAVLRELLHRQDSSQRRYLAAIKQLALVRKLIRPALSPFELASRPVPEGTPAGARREAAAPQVRLAGVN